MASPGTPASSSTWADVARYARAPLSAQPAKPLPSDAGRRLMTNANEVPTQRPETPFVRRSLGWDMVSADSINRPTTFSDKAFGHSGFSETSLWIDSEQDRFIAFLSDRVHSTGKGLSNPTAAFVGDAASAALTR
ncbi:MAG: serine hydrolase [Desulfobacterales bacterium]|nr:serine hydrolase [Desulfobacterales bacterium]